MDRSTKTVPICSTFVLTSKSASIILSNVAQLATHWTNPSYMLSTAVKEVIKAVRLAIKVRAASAGKADKVVS